MFEAVRQEISCPKCGRTIEIELWPQIDTDTEKALENIISGRLFDVGCECGFATQVQYPLSFEDKLHGVKLWYRPAEQAGEVQDEMNEASAAGLKCRLTASLDAFSEKAAIFAAGLDDRMVEVMKLAAKAHLAEALSGADVEPIVFASVDGVHRLLFRYEGQTEYMDMDMGEYNEFSTIFGPMLELAGDTDFVVDRLWAAKFLGIGASEETQAGETE